jgi:predicted RNA binding protein YcfA (HicA-like mRNA interferase family)
MLEFAVTVKGLDEDGHWVLAVEGDRLLIAHPDDKTLHWHPIKDCTFAKFMSPDQPRVVIPVQPQQNRQITVPTGWLPGNGR